MAAKKPFHLSLLTAFRGAIEASRSERNLHVQWVICVLVSIAGWLFQLKLLEWCCVILCFGSVLAAEMVNTSIESLVDLLAPEQREAARKAKDFAAGGVLMVSIAAVVIGCLIFGSHALTWLAAHS